MMNKLEESGRSMVEMLGVLAVMGVLSITGIMGYQYAMTKRAANELANDLWIEAVNLSVQALQKNDDLKISLPKTSGGYSVTAKYVGNDKNAFEISVDGVSYDVCQQVLNMSWSTPPNDIKVGEDGTENCVKDALHVMAFVFDAALQGTGANTGEGEDGDDEDPEICKGIMTDGVCCPDSSNFNGWEDSENPYHVVDGKCCKESVCCPTGETAIFNYIEYQFQCCPNNMVTSGGRCCLWFDTAGTNIPMEDLVPMTWLDGSQACCPSTYHIVPASGEGNESGWCCPKESKVATSELVCCGKGQIAVPIEVDWADYIVTTCCPNGTEFVNEYGCYRERNGAIDMCDNSASSFSEDDEPCCFGCCQRVDGEIVC